MSSEVLLILMPWTPPEEWLDRLREASPGIQITSRLIEMYNAAFPEDVLAETLQEVTILYTWKTFPQKEDCPNLKYVQLFSAGANQVLNLPLFKDTDVAFCTSNGVHP